MPLLRERAAGAPVSTVGKQTECAADYRCPGATHTRAPSSANCATNRADLDRRDATASGARQSATTTPRCRCVGGLRDHLVKGVDTSAGPDARRANTEPVSGGG